MKTDREHSRELIVGFVVEGLGGSSYGRNQRHVGQVGQGLKTEDVYSIELRREADTQLTLDDWRRILIESDAKCQISNHGLKNLHKTTYERYSALRKIELGQLHKS